MIILYQQSWLALSLNDSWTFTRMRMITRTKDGRQKEEEFFNSNQAKPLLHWYYNWTHIWIEESTEFKGYIILDYDIYMKKSKKKDSKYPEDDRDLDVYSDWEAGPDHYDFRNKMICDNRSV